MRFKVRCKDCEEIFFSENRKAMFCPTCEEQRIKKKAINKKKFMKPKVHGKKEDQQISVTQRIISGAEKELIIDRYRQYVEQMERPEGGRRATIAKMLGLPKKEVVRVIRDWNKCMSNTNVLSRQDRFNIEKKYFELLSKDISLSDIPFKIIEKTPYSNWQAARYLDLIHEMPKSLRSVEFPEHEKKKRIIEIYLDVLKGDTYPEPPLHNYISEIVNVTPKQVHKVLVDYRLRRRKI